MTIRIAYALVAMLFATSALAQTALPFGAPYNVEAMAAEERLAQQQPSDNTNDSPRGAPYHVVPPGEQTNNDPTLVPLRDYLSSRIDQLRAEIFDRIDQSEKQAQKVLDERDHQYAQRFDAQQEALSAALLAQKEAVANALSAAKEAVTKAEDASNKRFDSVNEFRGQLNDQVRSFMSKETAEARFAALEDKVQNNSSRLDAILNTSEGANSTWSLIGGGVLLIIAIVTFVMTARRGFHKEPT